LKIKKGNFIYLGLESLNTGLLGGYKREMKRKLIFSQVGLSTRALQALLGHDRLTTTEIYLNLSPEDAIREFLNKW